MSCHSALVDKSAAKELEDIPKKDLQKVVKRIRALAENPPPRLLVEDKSKGGSQKLSHKEQYRIRQGDYRVAYLIDDKDLLIDIVKIGHRREIYRCL